MNLTELIDTYCQAWSQVSPELRAELLARTLTPTATYTDPIVHTIGVSQLLVHIADVLARRPGSRVVRTSQVDHHHGIARFHWHVIESNGNLLPEGIDIAFLSKDGLKIERIVGFFGPLKCEPE